MVTLVAELEFDQLADGRAVVHDQHGLGAGLLLLCFAFPLLLLRILLRDYLFMGTPFSLLSARYRAGTTDQLVNLRAQICVGRVESEGRLEVGDTFVRLLQIHEGDAHAEEVTGGRVIIQHSH